MAETVTLVANDMTRALNKGQSVRWSLLSLVEYYLRAGIIKEK